MYQYDSKDKTQSKKLKTNTPATNKNHVQIGTKMPVQTKSLFSPSFNQESDREKSNSTQVFRPAQLMPLPYSSLQMQLMPKQEQREIQPLPMVRSEEQERPASIFTKPNNTGIPLQMKEKFENLSGFSFDDVRVHYNSGKPAQLQALAYTQGNQVYVGPGQEKHLPHELGHVTQQKAGIVNPTGILNGIAINDEPVLEQLADIEPVVFKQNTNRSKSDSEQIDSKIIQMKIGFEFEIGTLKSSKRKHFWYGERAQIVNNGDMREPCDKGEVLIRGNNFELQADEIGADSDLEFVTNPVDETLPGRVQLAQIMTDITLLCNQITNQLVQQKERKPPRILPLRMLGAQYSSTKYINFSWGVRQPIRAKPQVTMGIRLSKLSSVMEDVFNPPGELEDLTKRKQAGRAALTGLTPAQQPGPLLVRMGSAPSMAVAALTAYIHGHPSAPAMTEQMKSLLSIIIAYLGETRVGTRSYAKGAFPILMRTDFSKLFSMLNQEERDYYKQDNAQNLIDLVQSVNFAPAMVMGNPVFEGGIYNDTHTANHAMLNGLSKEAWIRGVANGVDLLTKKSFPNRAVRNELESIGGYGNKTDLVADAIHSPILELRSMPLAPLENWAQVADDVFRYIYNVNRGLNMKYGEAPNPLQPGSI